MTAQTLMTRKIAARTTESLTEMARILNDDFRDGSGIVLDAVMDELMQRLPDAEFAALCDSLADFCEQAMDGVRAERAAN
jgi:hypothetical protein